MTESGQSRAWAMALSTLAFSVALIACRSGPPDLRFESERWKSSTLASGVRYQMADDLINSHLLVGKSKEEVIALLGNPSLDRPDRMDYALGGPLGGTFGPGGDFQNILAIEFDRGGLAERVFRYED